MLCGLQSPDYILVRDIGSNYRNQNGVVIRGPKNNPFRPFFKKTWTSDREDFWI